MAPKKKTPVFARRAWNLLRLALLWARKGGAFKRGLMVELRLLPSYIKSLRHGHRHDSFKYQEREFSFDETPLFRHFNFHRRRTGPSNSMRFHMPGFSCIKPQVDFDFDFDFDFEGEEVEDEDDNGRKSFLKYEEEEEECESSSNGGEGMSCEMVVLEDEPIDRKAEEFIAKFYEQMKLQRQISYLQYTEMLDRGTS